MRDIGKGLVIIALVFFVIGCASSQSGKVYSREQARTVQTVLPGTVQLVNQVQIEGTKSKIGMIAGGAAGAALGNTIGRGTGKTVGTVLGAIAGGAAGSAAEEQLTKKEGLEITVKLDSGEVIAVVQEADEPFAVGERVRVLKGSDGTTRVTH